MSKRPKRTKKLEVTERDLERFVADHGLNRPLRQGDMQVVHRNGQVSIFNLDEEVKKLGTFLKGLK